ncbi:galactose-1-phosphate uridylyltransferase [Slackia heliotrinireducens]|uniref:Galactose-1-phosphate uridylyltransferase n=1 Tax=Slackia heliotrinireducens (strain ATCC 29202 / DSM 20476 / NCTC 11029 / RHS 1) TaxID=471855 RepID=C7N3W3_SLAHD|nr:UDP-glucose--hexose-1-phosphate uridylyltransferase [Slackia heliotrinireducens]ACV21704.1 galactose-1-phosphate uridyltransferase [Slackia heliotrinireducens DSM 20476]VEG99341.1 galactose-1-phosphate uridylyltransferase [Slackia heliotrinireducens]
MVEVTPSDAAEALIQYAISHALLDERDSQWAYNAVLGAIGADSPADAPLLPSEYTAARHLNEFENSAEGLPANWPRNRRELPIILDTLAKAARIHGAISRDENDERISAQLMDLVSPRPSQVERTFWNIHKTQGSKAAFDYFHTLSCDCNHIQTNAIVKDLSWSYDDVPYGNPLKLTVNKSKPEKDPRAIAKEAAVSVSPQETPYPACQLCIENEGYRGRASGNPHGAHPSRSNLRTVNIGLDGEDWALMYSPYAYYQEHCIAFSRRHTPMLVNEASLRKLFAFLEIAPHYFIGSNAGLPIVGGSILTHDHFQAGAEMLPLFSANDAWSFDMSTYPQVAASVVDWPLATIRLVGTDSDMLVAAGSRVMECWHTYSAESIDIVAEDANGPHNAITPFARVREDGSFELLLALRNNRTSEDRPLGIFHPRPEHHHIKRENIGLIEVAGLAILPGRLERELSEVERAIAQITSTLRAAGDSRESSLSRAGILVRAELETNDAIAKHAKWAADFTANRFTLDEAIEDQLKREIGRVFFEILEDASPFKHTDEGSAALKVFVESL